MSGVTSEAGAAYPSRAPGRLLILLIIYRIIGGCCYEVCFVPFEKRYS
jgi:hypothetical protein